ncbi:MULTISPECIES: hypothetical protein [Helcococcus]|uniref:Glycosyl hydrolase family protein n=1 Tax=Helcococcus bovis TaxID=3153252 RepID=A0ABW9F9F7_9FIRM
MSHVDEFREDDDEGNGTYDRYKKDSFYWFKKVIEINGSALCDY